jgi:hypothetical protein
MNEASFRTLLQEIKSISYSLRSIEKSMRQLLPTEKDKPEKQLHKHVYQSNYCVVVPSVYCDGDNVSVACMVKLPRTDKVLKDVRYVKNKNMTADDLFVLAIGLGIRNIKYSLMRDDCVLFYSTKEVRDRIFDSKTTDELVLEIQAVTNNYTLLNEHLLNIPTNEHLEVSRLVSSVFEPKQC